MILLGIVGAGMAAYSAYGALGTMPSAVIRKQLHSYLDANKLVGVKVKQIKRKGSHVFTVRIVLTYDVTFEDFKKNLPGIEQALAANIKFIHEFGATCRLEIGYYPFSDNMMYKPVLGRGLVIPLYTPFGPLGIDFGDESSTHLLVGGATRMGKSVFLRLMVTQLMLASKGNVRILLADNKITDLYMFRDIPQITCAETIEEAKAYLNDILDIAMARKEVLKSKRDVVDLKDLRKKYPEEKMDPIFVIIDEYGRFADDDGFQELVTTVAETAGYLDVHLVIASQRPDASTVLKPRIKANMLTRLCFKTSDDANSKIVLDLPDAAHIPAVKGRAVLLDGFTEVVQVPFISADSAVALLEPYRRADNADPERPDDSNPPQALQNSVPNPFGEADLSGSSKADNDHKPPAKAISAGWARIGSTSGTPQALPVRTEPVINTHKVSEDRTLPSFSRLIPPIEPTGGVYH